MEELTEIEKKVLIQILNEVRYRDSSRGITLKDDAGNETFVGIEQLMCKLGHKFHTICGTIDYDMDNCPESCDNQPECVKLWWDSPDDFPEVKK